MSNFMPGYHQRNLVNLPRPARARCDDLRAGPDFSSMDPGRVGGLAVNSHRRIKTQALAPWPGLRRKMRCQRVELHQWIP